jgi:hypothetical protein
MKFKDFFEGNDYMKIYRGRNAYQQGDGHYWSTDKEWARQFTQSGLDREISEKLIKTQDILKLNPLPKATHESEIDNAIKIGMQGGFKGIFVDEGLNQPNSVYLF